MSQVFRYSCEPDQRPDERRSDGMGSLSPEMCVCRNGDTRRFLCNPGGSLRLISKGSLLSTLLSCHLRYQRRLAAEIVSSARA